MSTSNPLVPQGTNPNAPKVKSNIKIAVVTILAIHVVLFGGLLLQGCKRDNQQAGTEQATNALPTFDPGAFAAQQQGQPAQPGVPATDPGAPATSLVQPTPLPVPQPGLPVVPEIAAPAPAGAAGEYVVKKGDYFEKIARENTTTVKALTAANPGVDSRRLKIGQKLVLPAPSAAAAAVASAPAEVSTPGFENYTVRSGDSLTKIASTHKTTIKALRAANNLKTDQIKVGQKLKVPVKAVAEAPPAVLPQAAAPPASPPGPAAAPGGPPKP